MNWYNYNIILYRGYRILEREKKLKFMHFSNKKIRILVDHAAYCKLCSTERYPRKFKEILCKAFTKLNKENDS